MSATATVIEMDPNKDLLMPKISEEFQSNFIRAEELTDELARTIRGVEIATFKEDDGSSRKKIIVAFDEDDRRLVCNASRRATLVDLFGDDTDDWVGRRVVLHQIKVMFGPKRVPSIAIREADRRPPARHQATASRPAAPARPAAEDPDDADVPF